MNTSKLYTHKSIWGYLLSALRAKRIWRIWREIYKYLRRVRLFRAIYRVLRILFLVAQTGALIALLIALFVALIPLILLFTLFLLIEHLAIYLRWRTVLNVMFSFDRRCYVYFCENVSETSFLYNSAIQLAKEGAIVFFTLPYRNNSRQFRAIKRVEDSVFFIKPNIYFSLQRKYFSKYAKNCVFILSDFGISNSHYTTRGEAMSR